MSVKGYCFRAAVLLAGMFVGGCATSPPDISPAALPAARFVMVNLSDCEWEIQLTPLQGVAKRWRVGPRVLIEDSLPAGEYTGKQTLLSTAGNTEASRSLAIRLEAGKDYRWRLTTLRSAPTVGGNLAGKAEGAGAR